MAENGESTQPNWWGSTLFKLKAALSRTKEAVVDSVVDHDEGGAAAPLPDVVPEAVQEASRENSETSAKADAGGHVAPQVVPELNDWSWSSQPVAPQGDWSWSSQQDLHYERLTEPVPASQPEPAPALIALEELQSIPQVALGELQQCEPVQTPPQVWEEPSLPQAIQQAVRHLPPPREIDEDYLEELEEKFIKADLGLSTAEKLVKDLRREAKAKAWNSRNVEAFLHSEFKAILAASPSSRLKLQEGKLNLILVVGVNGTGKTTSIGKLCWRLKSEGKKVLMAAGDTFRAAAESQLEIWAQRAGVDIVRLADGADPGAVIFQAIAKARKEAYDVLVIDTAGRLHNKANLMSELKKVRSVIDKHGAGCPLEALLVIDASTGQNGMQQAKVFTEVCPLTGVILTKLDGTARGGIVFSIARDLKVPVKLIGLGEQIDDLRDFEPELFVEALF